ncbi:unknown [[Mannheimia] succiniciproducens MBEL55E]|uniref:Uncharacterized protein n=1 Tax=Mannheimia succiniciproducens (strain KCTC 0769BP / MBEL55E) TaxID=221988 RepID=Q65TG0_MANSM|nr:unknown [[Mannheimia] succiniciproducens MBEL55E]
MGYYSVFSYSAGNFASCPASALFILSEISVF